ncbi:MAG: hypothetical protein ACREE2_15175 [Stellaceae bacterium]
MSGLAAAFKKAGITAKNPRWSWSARSADGKAVVMTLWKDLINYRATPISYSTFGRENRSVLINRTGNRERLENLKWVRDHCDGLFRVIITTAKDVNADTREIEDAHYQARMIMKLVELNEATGEFRAEVASDISKGPQSKKTSGDVMGNTHKVTRMVLPEAPKSGNSLESAAVDRHSTQPGKEDVLRARLVKGEIDHRELTREIISRFPKILTELAK